MEIVVCKNYMKFSTWNLGVFEILDPMGSENSKKNWRGSDKST